MKSHELITFAKQEGATKAAILNIPDTWAIKNKAMDSVAATKENITNHSNQSNMQRRQKADRWRFQKLNPGSMKV